MRRLLVLPLAAALLLLPGCLVAVNKSSRDHLAEGEARLDLPEPPDAAAARVVELLSRRGAMLVDRGAAGDAVLLRFKGARQTITTVGGGGTQGNTWVSGSTEALGSVFYVTFQPQGTGTRVWFLGRPSVHGREPCAPPGNTYPCEATLMATPAAGLLLTGREEAEAIRGVILELTGLKGSTAGPSTVAAPPPEVALPERPLVGPAPLGFLAATARVAFTLRVGPDDSAAISAEVRSGQKFWAGTTVMRGFRAVRTVDGKVGYAPDAAIEPVPAGP